MTATQFGAAGKRLCVVALLALCSSLTAQNHQIVTTNSASPKHRIYANTDCHFKKEYPRIKADKTDPRVAFVETFAFYHNESTGVSFHRWDPFSWGCPSDPNQYGDSDVFYDAAHRFFQMYTSETDAYSIESLTYFAGTGGHEGVILDFAADMDDLRATAFAYRKGKWEDVTKEYLGPFQFGEKDFLLLPQYGRAARVLCQYPDSSNLRFTHQGWLVWTGQKFELSKAKTRAGWRCSDHQRHVLADYFGKDETLPDFCRVGGESDPEN